MVWLSTTKLTKLINNIVVLKCHDLNYRTKHKEKLVSYYSDTAIDQRKIR
jgi:hypothetical protein